LPVFDGTETDASTDETTVSDEKIDDLLGQKEREGGTRTRGWKIEKVMRYNGDEREPSLIKKRGERKKKKRKNNKKKKRSKNKE
jgi:hypothetical protein